MLKHILKNIWTSITGCIAGLPTIIIGVQTHDTNTILLGAGVLLTGLIAKDANK
jgi:hypothetical protein